MSRNELHFYTPIMNYQKGNQEKQSHPQLHQKNKVPWNKLTKDVKDIVRKL